MHLCYAWKSVSLYFLKFYQTALSQSMIYYFISLLTSAVENISSVYNLYYLQFYVHIIRMTCQEHPKRCQDNKSYNTWHE